MNDSLFVTNPARYSDRMSPHNILYPKHIVQSEVISLIASSQGEQYISAPIRYLVSRSTCECEDNRWLRTGGQSLSDGSLTVRLKSR